MSVSNLTLGNPLPVRGKNASIVIAYGSGSPIGDTGAVSRFPKGSIYVDDTNGNVYVKGSSSWAKSSSTFSVSLAPGQSFLLPVAATLIRATEQHDTAASIATKLQVYKNTGTQAPSGGVTLLTNNTNAGFDAQGTANTVQTGTLVATSGYTTFAAGNRASLVMSSAGTSLVGATVTLLFQTA